MSTREVNKPYVVSADVVGLFTDWAKKHDYTAPSDQYIADYNLELQTALESATGTQVEVVTEDEINQGLTSLMDSAKYPVISLDRTYAQDHPAIAGHIDVTRTVNEDREQLGEFPRFGFPTLEEQLRALHTPEESPIVLVDDVIFTGGTIVERIDQLRAVNRPVEGIIAGIGIRKGLEKIEAAGVSVECVREYEEVYDEVCERDYFAGTPFSGRAMHNADGRHWGLTYAEPFGDAAEWASIPVESVHRFSQTCVRIAFDLWRETERLSGVIIPANTVPRRIPLLDGDTSISVKLEQCLEM
jgi:hypothetical protein